MTKTGSSNASLQKVTASLSGTRRGHIRQEESDAFVGRLKELIGANRSSFARKCGVKENTLRKYEAGSKPNSENLSAIADAGGVTVDWLATGRPPKTRARLGAETRVGMAKMNDTTGESSETSCCKANRGIDLDMLCKCVSACAIAHGDRFSAATAIDQITYATALYNQLVCLAADLDGRLESFSQLSVEDISQQLQILIKMGRVKGFPIPIKFPRNPKSVDF